MRRLACAVAALLVAAGPCLAQADTGSLAGKVVIEPADPKVKSVLVTGNGPYRNFAVQASADAGFEFTATGLRYGHWSIKALGFGFCSSPLPEDKYVAANSNQNSIRLVMKPCAAIPAQGRRSGLLFRLFPAARLVRAGFGQPAAGISGTIRLADGRSPQGAQAHWMGVGKQDGMAKELETDAADAAGRFSLRAERSSDFTDYLLSLEMPGYAPAIFSVPADTTALGELVLQPLADARSAPDIAMEPMLRSVFIGDLLQKLPLSGFRSFDSYALLLPGVFPPAQTWARTGPSLSPTVGTAGQFAVNGLRGRENNFVIDGSDTNDEQLGVRRQGFVSPTLQTLETIDELQVVTAIPDARFGRSIGGAVNALSRSGSDSVRFTAYGMLSDSRLNAREYFDQAGAAAMPAPVTVDGRALPPFVPAHAREPFTRWLGGASGAGAVPTGNRKTYFYAAFERQNLEATRRRNYATPAAAERQVDPAQRAALLPNDGSRVAPAGEAVFSLFPFPNNAGGPFGANTFTTELPERGAGDLYSLKLDRALTSAHSITLRYSRSAESGTLPDTGGALYSSIRPDLWNQNVAMFLHSSFTPYLANNLRASFGATHSVIGSGPAGAPLPSSLVPGAAFLLNAPLLHDAGTPGNFRYRTQGESESVTGFAGQVSIAGFSPAGVDVYRFPQTRANATWQAADTLTWLHGAHILSGGFDVRFIQLDSSAQRNARPSITFGGLATPAAVRSTPIAPQTFLPLALAAAGVPSGIAQTLAYGFPAASAAQTSPLAVNPSFPLHLRHTESDFYLQDEWRVKPWLSLTPGVRIAFAQLPSDADNRILRAFDRPALLQLASQTAQSRLCLTLPNGCGDLPSVFAAEFPQDFQTTFGANTLRADPRIGAALALGARTVLRAGWGRYSGQFPAIIITESQSSFPDFLPVNIAGYYPDYLTSLGNAAYNQSRQSAFPATGSGVLIPGTLNLVDRYTNGQNNALNPVNLLVLKLENAGLDLVQPGARLRAPYAMQDSLILERDLGGELTLWAGYVGTMGRHLLRVATPDLGFLRAALLPIHAPDPQSPRAPLEWPLTLPPQPSPGGLFSLARELYEGTANSAYHSLQAQLQKRGTRLLYGAAFTWAHAIDDASDFFDSAGAPALPQDSLRRSERASSSYDARLRGTGYFLWNHGAQFRNFDGWYLSGIFTAQSGQPFTVNSSIDVNRDGNLTDRPETAAGLQQGGTDRRTVLTLTRPAAALLPPPGSDGALGRNTFRAGDWYDLDLAAAARFRFGETCTLQLRVETFNIFNRANFGVPVRILGAPGFGSAVDLLTPPRAVQLGLRLLF